MSYYSTQGRSNHCLCFKTTDSCRDQLTLHPLVSPEPMEKSHRNTRKFLGLFSLWGQHLLRASIAQNCCCRSSALSLPFLVVSIEFPLSAFGLKTSVGRILLLLSYPLHKGNRLLGGRRNGNKSNERQRRGDAWALICTDTQMSALSFICPLSGLYQRLTSLPNSMISEDRDFLCLLDTGKWMQANRQGRQLLITTSKFR